MTIRHLEKIRTVLKDAVGLDISYAYEDIIFPEHAEFLLQFDDTDPNNYFCRFHEDCDPAVQKRLVNSLEVACKMHDCTLTPQGAFRLEQKERDIDIHFL